MKSTVNVIIAASFICSFLATPIATFPTNPIVPADRDFSSLSDTSATDYGPATLDIVSRAIPIPSDQRPEAGQRQPAIWLSKPVAGVTDPSQYYPDEAAATLFPPSSAPKIPAVPDLKTMSSDQLRRRIDIISELVCSPQIPVPNPVIIHMNILFIDVMVEFFTRMEEPEILKPDNQQLLTTFNEYFNTSRLRSYNGVIFDHWKPYERFFQLKIRKPKKTSWLNIFKRPWKGNPTNPNPGNPFLKETLDEIKKRVLEMPRGKLYAQGVTRLMKDDEEQSYIELINAMQAFYRIQFKADAAGLRDIIMVDILARFLTYFGGVRVNKNGHRKVAETWEKCRPDFVSWAEMVNLELTDKFPKKRGVFSR